MYRLHLRSVIDVCECNGYVLCACAHLRAKDKVGTVLNRSNVRGYGVCVVCIAALDIRGNGYALSPIWVCSGAVHLNYANP